MTIEQLLNKGADTLRKAGVSEYRLDAWYLLSYYMNIGKNEYYKNPYALVSDAQVTEYESLISERAKRKPLQYITGEQEFAGLIFNVNENVLIPRQDTEVIAELVIKHAKSKSVLDMCTGSGCIAVSVAKYSEALSVTASDVSENAISIAKKNAAMNNADIGFVVSDLWDSITGKYDILVSNPPYITSLEMTGLMPEVFDYEPHLALLGGDDGLFFYKKILKDINKKITDGGMVFFEIGCSQADAVAALMKEQKMYDIKVEKDLAGLDRVVWGYVGG